MNWLAVAATVSVSLFVIAAAIEAGRSFRRYAGGKGNPTYSPGEAVWLSIAAIALPAALLSLV